MQKYIRIALLGACVAGGINAQPVDFRFTAGVTSFADEGAINHKTVGGSARLYFSKRWSVEPEILHMWTDRNHSDSILWGNVSFDFRHRDKRVTPYWFGGPGVIFSRQSFGSSSFNNTEAAFGTGAGVRIFLSDRVFVAPQVRMGIADGIFGEFTGSIGFVLRK